MDAQVEGPEGVGACVGQDRRATLQHHTTCTATTDGSPTQHGKGERCHASLPGGEGDRAEPQASVGIHEELGDDDNTIRLLYVVLLVVFVLSIAE